MSRRAIVRVLVGCGAMLAVGLGVWTFDRLFPPKLTKYHATSSTLSDRDGRLLRVKLSDDGAIRMATRVGDVDPLYLKLLVAYEDKRFHRHPGVDGLAMARAIWQAVANWRVISGGSTLTMQVGRLLEPRRRTIWAKLVECVRALQLERRFTKTEILDMYLTLAPFGGPLEGVRAASLAYFDKEPKRLKPAEAALLVALPQMPSRLRPERYPARAKRARDKILSRTLARWDPGLAAIARLAPLPARRLDFPLAAPHLADRLFAASDRRSIGTTIDRDLQVVLSILARRHGNAEGEAVAAAIIVIENATRVIRAYVGSGDYLSIRRRGGVDMVNAWRSPGSALKPFIYGLALDAKLIHPATLISDRRRSFAGYAPRNFNGRGLGDVSVADALRLSLNVPAVATLSALGPVTFLGRLEHLGVEFRLPKGNRAPGLAVAIGGLAARLRSIAGLYAGLANAGAYRAPNVRVVSKSEAVSPSRFGTPKRLVGPGSARLITDILRTGKPPRAHRNRALGSEPFAIAFKTGTSYGFRDAWAFGYTPSHTIGVWSGHVDGSPRPGASGRAAALPLLFDAFAAVAGWAGDDWRIWDQTPVVPAVAPVNLTRLARRGRGWGDGRGHSPLDLHFPTDGMVLEIDWRDGALSSVPLEAMGGRGRLTWLINGQPLRRARRGQAPRRADRTATWHPDQPGGAEITVLDQAGRSRSARVWITIPDT
jgi:penicillin-binding protein 1C